MLYIASDYMGFVLKQHLFKYIQGQLKIEIEDMGPAKFNPGDDFTDTSFPLARKVAKNQRNLGILICGSGHGMCISANKIKGIRAGLAWNIESAETARKNDDANILCLPSNFLSQEHAEAMVKKFLDTEFEALERRVRRLAKIAATEK